MRALILLAAACLALGAASAAENKVVCYFGSWSIYRQGAGKFNIDDIDASLCTHLIYSFVVLNGNKAVSHDPGADLPEGQDGFRRFTELRKKNPSAKVLIAIGGWNDSQGPKYSNMVSSPAARKEFIDSVVALLKQHKFDGFDVDWEYPTQNGGKQSDRANYVSLLKELRERFDKEGGYILSAAVAAPQGTASQAYDIPKISKYLDFINLMTYDFHGSWERQTGHHAALHGSLSVESVVKYWLSQGCPKQKLVVGVPTYGRAWTLSNAKNNGIGAPTSGPGEKGPYTQEASMLGYNEICEFTTKGGWSVHIDEASQSPYAVKGKQWVGYDNVKSVTEKANFIKEQGLGGAMIWSIETDDFKGSCGEKYPILKSLNAVLRNGEPVPEESTPSAPIEPVESEESDENNVETPGHPGVDAGDGECTESGIIADPSSCNFISCVDNGQNGFVRYERQCPEGLCFNPAIGVCDWPQQ